MVINNWKFNQLFSTGVWKNRCYLYLLLQVNTNLKLYQCNTFKIIISRYKSQLKKNLIQRNNNYQRRENYPIILFGQKFSFHTIDNISHDATIF